MDVPTKEGLVARLREALGAAGVLSEAADMAAYCTDWRGLRAGRALAVARPASTAEVVACVKLCAAAGVSIVPQGGNTSLVAGASPSEDGGQVVLTLARMNRVREMDAMGAAMTVDAGMTLKAVQDAAAGAGMLLPLSINAEGTAQIGGVLATNAGGNNTLRFGNARELVLGLEVVLADGSVIEGLRKLRKDNTGYALRQLFVGAEGTLGIITGAVLKLEPAPKAREAAFCALPGVEAVLALYARLRAADAASLYAFEYMSGTSLGLVLSTIEGRALPVGAPAPCYVLADFATTRAGGGLRAMIEETLAAALEAGEITDAAIAETEAQRLAFWTLREEHTEAQKRAGASVKNDVSVPIASVPALLTRAEAVLRTVAPGCRMVAFGHIGDGNIHLNAQVPEGGDDAAFLLLSDDIMHAVNDVVKELGGSFSAEHGVGRIKRDMVGAWRGGAELAAMRKIKAALDPEALFNPGVMLP